MTQRELVKCPHCESTSIFIHQEDDLCLCGECGEAWERATKAHAVPRWIPVSERMPPVGERCLFYRPLADNSGDNVITVKTAMKNGQHCWTNTVPDGEELCNPSNGACHVSHWMPLPSAPEQNKLAIEQTKKHRLGK
jgi:hypothetical protein